MSYFNPPAPCGAGPPGPMRLHGDAIFQSTRPLRGGTTAGIATLQARAFQSTRPLRGGTCKRSMLLRCFMPFQSTRPLRGGTFCRSTNRAAQRHFNPPAPCGAGLGFPRPRSDATSFQSTRPLRGGTGGLLRESVARGISIHPPLAGRDLIHAAAVEKAMISIHPPLAGRDPYSLRRRCGFVISIHPPLAGRDQARARAELTLIISIHPPLAGRDCGVRGAGWLPGHFNPPAPCGAGL